MYEFRVLPTAHSSRPRDTKNDDHLAHQRAGAKALVPSDAQQRT